METETPVGILLTRIAIWGVRVMGTVQLVLGLLLWSGNGYEFLPFHILNGIALVGLVWVLAALSFWAGTSRRLAAVAAGWGLVTLAFGLAQSGILLGEFHWVVQLAHLLVGITLLGLGVRLGMGIVGPAAARRRGLPS